jgi:hypothetical protein
MKQMKITMMLVIILILVSCTRIEFDSFDPTTSTLKWMIQNERN